MKVRNHRLMRDDGLAAAYLASPHAGGTIAPRFMIIHYTGGSSAEGTISWFRDPKSKVSAHLVIVRDGTVTQRVPFNHEAWHADQSHWGHFSGLNHHSIGIELDKAGILIRSGGKRVSKLTRKSYPDRDVTVAPHKNNIGFDADDGSWSHVGRDTLNIRDPLARILNFGWPLDTPYGRDTALHEISPGLVVEPAAYRNGLTPKGGLSKADKDWIVESYPGLKPREVIPKLEVGLSQKLAIKAGQTRVFSFTPKRTRTYRIGTFGTSDTVMVLFEATSSGNVQIAGNDDSGTDLNARIDMRLYYAEAAAETSIMVW